MAALAALLAMLLAGCAGGGGAPLEQSGRLVLDGPPRAAHAGVYTTLARDYGGGEGVRLTLRRPGRRGAVAALRSGRADLAVLPLAELARARAAGTDLVGVMALAQRPLGVVLAEPGVRSPRALAGRRVGLTGLAGERAVLASVVAGAGGDPGAVRAVALGPDADPGAALRSGRVAAVTAASDREGAELLRRRPGLRAFRPERLGAPAYPELVLAVSRRTLEDRPSLVRGAVAALRRGYQETLRDPESAVLAFQQRVRGVRREPLLADLRAVAPALTVGAARFGVLDRDRLEAWARWAERTGLVARAPDVGRAFAPELSR